MSRNQAANESAAVDMIRADLSLMADAARAAQEIAGLTDRIDVLLHAAGLEIGAHTATHPDLGTVSDRRILQREIVDAGRRLEDVLGHRVRYFAFPFGQYVNMQVRLGDVDDLRGLSVQQIAAIRLVSASVATA